MDPPANKIGRYLVLEGGPVRFVAYDPELGRKVDLEVGIDPRMRRRAQRVAQLVHPNVVRLHDVGVHGERLYLAFDHVEGETVRSWCERERPSWRSVLEAFVDAGEGIAATHRAGLVHGAIDLDALVRGDDERVRVRELVRSEDVDIVEGEPDSERDRVAFARALETALSGSTKDVPRRLRRVLQEGLDADRPMSIDAFVSRLRRERPRARRWAWSIAAMALVAAGFAARGDDAHRDIASVTYCGTFDARLAKLWNAEVRDEVARGVAALEAEFAVAAWDGAATRLDTYVDELARAQARDCSRREAGEAVPEAVSLCLHRRFESLNTFLRALEQPSTSMMANLSDSLGTLGSPQQCEALDNAGPPVIGVDLAVLLDLEAQLSDAAMQSRLGRPADAIVSAKKAMRVAESIDARWYVAEAEFLTARAQWELDDEEAIDSFHRAFASALASEHADVMCKSAIDLAALLAERGRSDEARRWLDHAAAAQERTGDPRPLARIAVTRGEIEFFDGDYAKAKVELERAMQRVTLESDLEIRYVAEQLHAATLEKLGDVRGAIAALEATVQHAEEAYGAQHPVVAAPLISLASMQFADGRLDDATRTIERAAATTEAAFGTDHWGTMSARLEQMTILDASGQSDRAVEIADRLLDTAERVLGPKDIRYPGVLDAVARVYFPAGREEEAIALFREAVRLHEIGAGEQHPSTLIFMGNLAASLLFSNRLEEAEVTGRIVLERNEEVLGPDHPQLVLALLGLAQSIREQGRWAEAAPLYQRALDLAETHAVRGERLGAIQFNYAVALWDGDIDRARALELARAALRNYAAAERDGWVLTEEIAAARTWLNEREARGRRSGS